MLGKKNKFLIPTNEGGIVKDKVGRNKKMTCAGTGRLIPHEDGKKQEDKMDLKTKVRLHLQEQEGECHMKIRWKETGR